MKTRERSEGEARLAVGQARRIVVKTGSALIAEAGAAPHPEDRFIIEALGETPLPVFLVINKIDLVDKPMLLPLIDLFLSLHPFREILPLSALKGDGVDRLIGEIWKALPEGPQYFPEEMMTDRSERFIAAEIIREKITLRTHQEIPYATAVVVDAFKEDEAKNMIRIAATIHVAKDSQKGIVIGKGGGMIKRIGTLAREELEARLRRGIALDNDANCWAWGEWRAGAGRGTPPAASGSSRAGSSRTAKQPSLDWSASSPKSWGCACASGSSCALSPTAARPCPSSSWPTGSNTSRASSGPPTTTRCAGRRRPSWTNRSFPGLTGRSSGGWPRARRQRPPEESGPGVRRRPISV